MITLSTGTTVATLQDPSLGLLVILDHPDSPDDIVDVSDGRTACDHYLGAVDMEPRKDQP